MTNDNHGDFGLVAKEVTAETEIQTRQPNQQSLTANRRNQCMASESEKQQTRTNDVDIEMK